ncbi:MAG: cytochrome c3 family protein [Nitrospirae bacterium]|nr:cytochrome c3 family protein [Nitrospirota bacterium]
MYLRYNGLLQFFIILALTFIVPEKSAGHNFIGKVGCFECHERLPIGISALKFRPNIERVCMKCHNLEKRLTHPVNVVPKVIIPLDLPLDQEGKVTCVTCHKVHMPALNKLTGKKTYYLRRVFKGKKFCYSCHATLPV